MGQEYIEDKCWGIAKYGRKFSISWTCDLYFLFHKKLDEDEIKGYPIRR